jgi:hypothetical protein
MRLGKGLFSQVLINTHTTTPTCKDGQRQQEGLRRYPATFWLSVARSIREWEARS